MVEYSMRQSDWPNQFENINRMNFFKKFFFRPTQSNEHH